MTRRIGPRSPEVLQKSPSRISALCKIGSSLVQAGAGPGLPEVVRSVRSVPEMSRFGQFCDNPLTENNLAYVPCPVSYVLCPFGPVTCLMHRGVFVPPLMHLTGAGTEDGISERDFFANWAEIMRCGGYIGSVGWSLRLESVHRVALGRFGRYRRGSVGAVGRFGRFGGRFRGLCTYLVRIESR